MKEGLIIFLFNKVAMQWFFDFIMYFIIYLYVEIIVIEVEIE